MGDAYINGAWRTILVGSLRAGGQAVFAIDITDPGSFSTANVLWEFSDNDDPDLGYTFSKPVIARLHDGRWAAIFGNGYNNTELDGSDDTRTKRNGKPVVSSTGEAVLYVVYLDEQPPKFIKLQTDPVVTDPTGAKRPNGFATPAVVNVNIESDFAADYIYVGDLFGNLWKFDITDSNPNNWQGKPLFQAIAYDQHNHKIYQPITTRPVVSYHPSLGRGHGYMIYFGTGKYFETGDNQYSGATPQSFYGIWDYNTDVSSSSSAFNRDQLTSDGQPVLYEQKITSIGTNDRYRTLTPADDDHKIKWFDEEGNQYNKGWYIDFPLGEKQITNATIWNKRVIFTTLVLPQGATQSCDSDGSSSWLMVVNSKDGGRLMEPTFDLNGDLKFDSADLITTTGGGSENGGNNPSGEKSDVGALPELKIGLIPPRVNDAHVNDANACDITLINYALIGLARGTGGGVFSATINPGHDDIGRQSWRQLWR